MSREGRGAVAERLMGQLLVVAGSVSLLLGVVGVFLPILPTTPFLLLAAACYLRSSPRLYERLVRSRFVGSYIRCYRDGTGIPVRAKAAAISLLWLTVGYSVVFVVDSAAIRVLLVVIAAAVAAHILAIRPSAR